MSLRHLCLVLALLSLGSSATAQVQPCGEDDDGSVAVQLAGPWPAALGADLLQELSLVLADRRIPVCRGKREQGKGARLVRSADHVTIHVWDLQPAPSQRGSGRRFALDGLPTDAVAFALARATDEQLQYERVVPRQRPEETPVPVVPDVSLPAERPAASTLPTPLITLGADASLFVKGAAQFGATLGWQQPLTPALRLSIEARGAILRETRTENGRVEARSLGAALALLWSWSREDWSIATGPLLGGAAVRFAGHAEGDASARTGWAPTLFAGVRGQLVGRLVGAFSLIVQLDVQAVLAGARARDGSTPLAGLERARLGGGLGFGLNL